MDQLRKALGSNIMDDKVSPLGLRDPLVCSCGADSTCPVLWQEHYELSIEQYMPASRSPVDTPLWEAMKKAANTLYPGTSFAYPTLPGATDSRFYRQIGTVAYGANLFDPVTDFAKLMRYFHGSNEQINTSSLLTSVQFYTLTVLNMMGGNNEDK
jgi:acetylornithine deacetylase/succinyl-diaminopimelate desuccinylase-like protein